MNVIAFRLLRFRRQLVALWHAFWHPATPFYLKAIMVGALAYLISPIDLLPDVFAFVGWIDDAILVAFAVNWIIARLPDAVFGSSDQDKSASNPSQPKSNTKSSRRFATDEDNFGPTIDGSARRL